ncbi:MAG: SufE family protein [Pseudomonadota bacterium]|jgi:cysteine desulfuration protein SufE|nr:SufE family protein [Pseudomonadota bacterium]|tara:strand:- start:104 stop:526 length:423 start_codon:yes stop_codon:yes gene_type:complete
MSDLKIEDLITDFEFFDNWEDKYKYIIELGKNCPSLNENEKNNDNKVDGCASQVWLITKKEKLNDKIILKFKGDSDALIVKGLVVILFSIFSEKSPDEIIKIDAFEKLRNLDLERNLTMQRSNGLSSMVKRIKEEAQKYI